jgi:NagD protein
MVFGKPSPSILLELCGRLQLAADELAMVGDRIYTDIRMAQEAGVPSVLVLTGEATAADAAGMPNQPDLVVADIGELGERLDSARCASGGVKIPWRSK